MPAFVLATMSSESDQYNAVSGLIASKFRHYLAYVVRHAWLSIPFHGVRPASMLVAADIPVFPTCAWPLRLAAKELDVSVSESVL